MCLCYLCITVDYWNVPRTTQIYHVHTSECQHLQVEEGKCQMKSRRTIFWAPVYSQSMMLKFYHRNKCWQKNVNLSSNFGFCQNHSQVAKHVLQEGRGDILSTQSLKGNYIYHHRPNHLGLQCSSGNVIRLELMPGLIKGCGCNKNRDITQLLALFNMFLQIWKCAEWTNKQAN